MLAAQEAGCSSLDEFLGLDSTEYTAWTNYAIAGPSRFRTQLLLAQLIQVMNAGSKPVKIEDLLPYHDSLLGITEKDREAMVAKRHQAAHQSMIDNLIAKRTEE